MEYLIILIIIFFITFLLEKIYRVRLYHNHRERLKVVGLFFIIGVILDSFAIWRGYWIFSSDKILGIVIGVMPIEEYLFMLIIPYFIITVYKVIDHEIRRSYF